MRAVIQRVRSASVTVAGEAIGEIDRGLVVLVGVTHDDTAEVARKMATKVWGIRIFADDEGLMNRSVGEVDGAVLVVSQFTLYGNATKGRRPSFVDAAPGPVAEPLVDEVVAELVRQGATVATGRFGADMAVALVNDGPVTIVLDL